MLSKLIHQLKQTKHGFKHVVTAGDNLLNDEKLDHLAIAIELLSDESYQGRMLATYLLSRLSTKNDTALALLKAKVAYDDNWRVQEMLAKAIDQYCKTIGYQKSLPELKQWLDNPLPNLNRAAIEGLRIWTSRPYFKDHPQIAIDLISNHKTNNSEYVRKSVGNALRDIAKKHYALVSKEIESWDLDNNKIAFVYKLTGIELKH